MKTTAALMCAAVLASGACGSRGSADDSNASCVERLEIPLYPLIAQSARVTALLTASVLIGRDGTAEKVVIESAAGKPGFGQLFFPSIEKAMKASKFASGCSGKTARLMFDFKLSTRAGASQTAQEVSFTYPNRFEISLAPPQLVP